MIQSIPASLRRLVLIAGLVPALTAFAQSEGDPIIPVGPVVQLDSYVVSANRGLQNPERVSSAVSIVPLADVAAALIPSLTAVLEQQPGVILTTNGGRGSQGSILMRGSSSHHTLFVVDGLRMSDRSIPFFNFLGVADLGGVERIEVLRGAQSTLYGSSAMGGVILMDTVRGSGPMSENMAVSFGSFGSYGAQAWTTGAKDKLSYSASLGYAKTDNDRPDIAFKGWSGSTRLEYAVSPTLKVGGTFRGQDTKYEEPGSRFFPSPATVDFTNTLATLYAEAKPAEGVTSRLTIGQHIRDYNYKSAYGDSPLHNNRLLADWQNTWEASSQVQVIAGLNFEDATNDVAETSNTERLLAGYVSTTYRPIRQLTLNAGVRHDDFRRAEGATTGRAGAAWNVASHTKLRISGGTGFCAPGSDDQFGVPSYGQLPSPGLLPEKSRGWDVGVDQDILGGSGQVALTYFQNKFRNLFEYETVNFTTFEGRIVNRTRASTEGLELAAAGRVCAKVHVRGSYTYVEATNDVTGTRLTRRPRHTGDAEVRFDAMREWTFGAGVHVVSDRLNGATPMEDYTKARVFVSYQNADGLRAGIRVENALNEKYEETYGYPALPLGVFGSIEWKF